MGEGILFRKKESGRIFQKIVQSIVLVIGLYSVGVLFVNLLGYWIDVHSVPYLYKTLRWNVHNIVLFLIFMMIKIRNNRKKQQILFGISIVSCLFALTQIGFLYLFVFV